MRIAYIAATTLVSCAIPFFGDLMSLIGAVAITPTTFILPRCVGHMQPPPSYAQVRRAHAATASCVCTGG